ncbi:MAG: bifunctional 3-deoxy-7-phosphoheptulonate synthase/chorismate mutase type II [Bacteroidales bacterium]|nr:bifunctional 3-deoxy-7-phosphoheptulonate synthase/chorismate mutase type II [Bacteroidales bacterium]MCK9498156.1 bifunctional 3-deoxy-7-phosphoheptulonate synthase/chorismate mutase type II [Bacteroidales bacterium]MDY0315188.1 chorismate mutase [Bacteroidales bacterium]
MCKDFTIIAGPCSAESQEQVLLTAKKLSQTLKPDYFRAGVWKPRTRPGSFEGVGTKALTWLNKVQTEFGIKAITEAGSANHVEKILKNELKAFWVGARTVANPFSVQEIVSACDKKDIEVFVKNPIHPDIELWMGAIERFLVAGIKNVYAIHRGFYPYEKTHLRNIPRWEIPIELARRLPEVKIICDPSHIAGKPEYIKEISQRAINLNMCGLMVETHYNPKIALSDKEQQITPENLAKIISELNFRKTFTDNSEYQNSLNDLREKIDAIDFQLIDMLEHRFKLVDEIGNLKKDNNITILQLERWKSIIESRLNYANQDNISKDFLLKVLQMIHKESILRQNKIFDEEK